MIILNSVLSQASGVADKAICPTLVRIAKLASKLDENKKDSMVLGVDTVGGKIYVRPHGQTTTAIYKKA